VEKILEILMGRVSASFDGVAVLRVMVERRVLLLKRRAHPLCDFFGPEDSTREAVEELEDDMIM
jgi:hypothetical protein